MLKVLSSIVYAGFAFMVAYGVRGRIRTRFGQMRQYGARSVWCVQKHRQYRLIIRAQTTGGLWDDWWCACTRTFTTAFVGILDTTPIVDLMRKDVASVQLTEPIERLNMRAAIVPEKWHQDVVLSDTCPYTGEMREVSEKLIQIYKAMPEVIFQQARLTAV